MKNNPDTHKGIQVIILAGGLGTRLRESVPDLPKCMAPVGGRPFLFHVINHLRLQGINRFVFSLGYKHEIIESWLADQFSTLDYQCVIEAEPLGTGGAIRLACQHADSPTVLIVNGDTLFRSDIASFLQFHQQQMTECSLSLKEMQDVDRYGVVETNEQGILTEFKEKQYYSRGLINAGVYLLERVPFLQHSFPSVFSFEKDYLEKQVMSGGLSGLPQEGYFIDIGIPADFGRAQTDLQKPEIDLKKINHGWTLFLDRDGVINEDKPGSYIFHPDEFSFMPGAPELFRKLTERFRHILVVTNQRGVGKGLMTEETLGLIHQKMMTAIGEAGGHIAGIYYATALDNKDPLRKPNPGMAVQAMADFPEIDLGLSIMIGNNLSDMQFGRNAGMYTVFVRTTTKDLQLPHPDIDLIFDSLSEFANSL